MSSISNGVKNNSSGPYPSLVGYEEEIRRGQLIMEENQQKMKQISLDRFDGLRTVPSVWTNLKNRVSLKVHAIGTKIINTIKNVANAILTPFSWLKRFFFG